VAESEWATLALAVVGALTGVAALGAQIWSYIASGPRIKVSLSDALMTASGKFQIGVDVTNVGRMPVEVLEVGLLLNKDNDKKAPIHAMHLAYWVGPDLPLRLQDGSQTAWFVEPSVIALKAREEGWTPTVRGYVRLGTGKVIRTRRGKARDALSLAQLNSQP
jgi:hypothetical protein